MAFQTHPGSPALFLEEAKYSAFLSSRDGNLLSGPATALLGAWGPSGLYPHFLQETAEVAHYPTRQAQLARHCVRGRVEPG